MDNNFIATSFINIINTSGSKLEFCATLDVDVKSDNVKPL